jgi:chorismate mutase
MGSLKVAVSLGGIAAAWAKGIATTFLFTVGGALAGGLLYAGRGKAGQIMAGIGKAIEERVGIGGIGGWRSLVSQRFGRAIRERGERLIKERYEADAEAAKLRVESINKQLERTTNPAQIANLTSQLNRLIQQFRGNDYVLKNINESIRNMSSKSAAKILTQQPFLQMMTDPQTSQETKEAIAGLIRKVSVEDAGRLASNQAFLQATASQQSPEEIQKATAELIRKVSAKNADALISTQTFLQTAAGQQAPEVIREATAELIDKLRKSNFKTRMNDTNWVQNLQNLSQEFINAVAERIEKDFKEGDVIDFMADNTRINAIQAVNLAPLRDRLNRASRNFLEAVITPNVNEAANALSRLSRDFWQEQGITTKIYNILQNRQFQPYAIQTAFLDAIGRSSIPEEILSAALREDRQQGPVRNMLRNAFSMPRGQQLKASLSTEAQRRINFL